MPQPMRDSLQYAQLRQRMTTGTDHGLLADLARFVESFGDHDPDCPSFAIHGRDAEFATCTCGYARRYDFFDELSRRLERRPGHA